MKAAQCRFSFKKGSEFMSAPCSMDELFARLSRSAFRTRFQLKAKELAYIEAKGLPTIRRHAEAWYPKA